MSHESAKCPGCGSLELSTPYCLPDQPVVLNYRFNSVEESRNVARRDVTLVQCQHCGLVFNSTFDATLVPYDERYENRQCCSPAFQTYLKELAQDLAERNCLRGGCILEVGCGKGDFLRLICEQAAASGEGFDTTYEGPANEGNGKIQFHQQYVTPAGITQKFDAIICRHVIEHVPRIGAFLRELRNLAEAAGDPVVVIETPSFEWIVANGCFWDVFHEHCNYFPSLTLAYLAGEAGFQIERQTVVFGGQYQLLEMKCAEVSIGVPPGVSPNANLLRFAEEITTTRTRLEQRLLNAEAEKGWAIWGAGAKGVALVNQLRIKPRFLVDSNPAKQNCIVPGSDIPILSPDDPRVLEIPLIVVANPNYFAEIKEALAARGFHHSLISI